MIRSVEEIQAARAARKAASSKARDEQFALDLEALDGLEMEHGDDRVQALNLPAFVAGLPTMVVVQCPSKDYYKRFQDMVRRAKGEAAKLGPASEALGDACVAYPAKDMYAKVRDAFPGIHDSVVAAAVSLAQAKSSAEGND